jgi:diacylglycerol kinase family enzyme
MDTTVLINHKAGSARWSEREIADQFKALDWSVNIQFVRPKKLVQTLNELCDSGVKTIIIGGGDGSISTAAAILANRDVTLGILPMGTFNLFAIDINMPIPLPEAIRALHQATPHQIDLGQLNQHIFLNKASIGLHPFAIETRRLYQKKWRLSKRLAITFALISSVWHSPNLHISLKTPEGEQEIDTPFLVVGNNEYDTGPNKLLDRQEFDRGHLCIFYAHEINRITLLRMGIQAFLGWKLKAISDLETIMTTAVDVHLKKKHLTVAIDGEVAHFDTPLQFQILPKTLRVLLPPAQTALHLPRS